MRLTPLLAALMVLVVGVSSFGAVSDSEVNGWLDTIDSYQYGDSRVALLALEDKVNHSTAIAADRERLADLIAARLSGAATVDAKSFLCRQLHTIGSAKHVPALAALLTDEKLSHMARYALERIPGSEANAALTAALHQTTGETLLGVIQSVGVRGEGASAQALAPFLRDPDEKAALAAADALGYIATTDSLRAIDAGFEGGSAELRERLSLAALRAAQGLAARGNTKAPLRVYERLYTPEQPVKIRIAALTGLAQTLSEGEAIDRLVRVLANNDKDLTATALRRLQFLNRAGLTGELVGHLDHADEELRNLYLHTLGERGDTAAAAALIRYAKTGGERDRQIAVESLGKAGTNEALGVLARIAVDNTGSLRDAAKGAIVRLNQPGTNGAILAAANGADDKVAGVLIESLALRGASDTAGALLKIAGDGSANSSVRRSALNTLAGVGGVANIGALIDLMTGQSEASLVSAAQRAVALIAVNSADPSEAAAAIIASHVNASGEARIDLAQILGKVATKNAYKAVEGDLSHSDKTVKDAALKIVAAWPNAEPLELMKDYMKRPAGSAERSVALRGYVRMLGLADSLSADAKLAGYRLAFESAANAGEKKVSLTGLSKVYTQAALDYARSLVRDKEVPEEAKQTSQSILRELNRVKRLKEMAAEREKTFQ
jgi:HEAT repeat protein